MSATGPSHPVRPERVEEQGRGFDKLTPNGYAIDANFRRVKWSIWAF